jgi:hypothetical protein
MIKIDGVKKTSTQKARGYRGNTHRPWNDQHRSVEDLLGVGFSCYTTPIIEHLKICKECNLNRVMWLLEKESVSANSHSERIARTFFDDPRTTRKQATNTLVKLQGLNSLFWLGTKLSKEEFFEAIRMAYLKAAMDSASYRQLPLFKTVIPRSARVAWDATRPNAEVALQGPHPFGPDRSRYTKMSVENRELLTKAATLINAKMTFPNTMDELERTAIVHKIQTS